MKNIIILLIIPFISFSQTKGLIYYGYIESLPNGNAKGNDYNTYMIFNSEMANYVTAKDSLEKSEKGVEAKTSHDDNGDVFITSGLKVSAEGDQVIYNIKKKTMWSNFLFKEQVYVKEVVPVINWKIFNETRKIGNFKCKKATANFRGREYTAWFTNEISVPFGPWKLQGLPGLILEAYDTNKHVYWYFKSIEYPSKSKENVQYMKIPKNKTFKNYNQLKIFQNEQIESNKETQRIVKKDYPNVIFEEPKKEYLFIECE